ncbi:DUF2057 family protein [Vibrio navarrensis]|uniref:YccT family protein n=1 Tax=Vibrio navarrensis TaxID=29495 RepID=UPI0018DDCE68|nr:DUF2057 family protein [Vibrio navarrensis]MBH9740144.1 hypothetical protein [Vibrio navarrensis]
MKNMILLGLLALFSTVVSAATVTLQKEITPQIVNGQGVTLAQVHNGNQLELNSGHNQIALTIGQLVFEDGKRRKFDSQLLLIEFDAQPDQQLILEYEKFRTIEEAKQFAQTPNFRLRDEQGQAVEFSLVQLYKGGLQGFRDYESEVADYNAQRLVTAETGDVESAHKTREMQQAFRRMTRAQQQTFMQWAMQNLK